MKVVVSREDMIMRLAEAFTVSEQWLREMPGKE